MWMRKVYTYQGSGRLFKTVIIGTDGNFEQIDDVYVTTNIASKGLLQSTTKKLNNISSTAITTSYQYDNLGRPTKITETIDGRNFDKDITYNSLGQLLTLTYPSYDGTNRLEQQNIYNSQGELRTIKKGDKNLWSREMDNEYGQPLRVILGNNTGTIYYYNDDKQIKKIQSGTLSTDRPSLPIDPSFPIDPGSLSLNATTLGITLPELPGSDIQKWVYEYNVKGLMSSRQDSLLMQKETFAYDNLDRLTNVNQQIIIPPRLYNINSSISYDNQGNIQNKTDIGTYTYNQNKPNAISSILEPATTAPSLFNPLTHHINTEVQQTFYNVYNKIDKITQGTKELKFYYNSSQDRIKTEYKLDNLLQKTTYYIGNYECEVYPNGRIRELNYINTNTGNTIVELKDNNNGTSTDSLYYIFKDHLGSYDRITNQLGQIVEIYSFDAWGNRRSPNDCRSAPTPMQIENYKFSRGFTGHEHLDAFQLINMNGRLYDPVIDRFLSPDPYVASSSNTQDFNRYSYCRNNPLLYTDPSGEFIWLIPNVGWSKSGGLSVGLTFMVGIPGGASAQIGVGYGFKSKDFNAFLGGTLAGNTLYANYSTQSKFSVGWSVGLSPQMGFPISTNFASMGVNYNITNDIWSANVSSWNVSQNSCKFDPSVSVMICPEQTTNLVRGQGFRSNSSVYNRMMQEYSCQDILDYFGFKGTYDPSAKEPGNFFKEDGSIKYNDVAFSRNYDYLHAIATEELFHSRDYLYGEKNAPDPVTAHQYEEWRAQIHLYKNQGLYLNADNADNYVSRINFWGMQAGVYSAYIPCFSKRWWHFIYKIPREW